MIAVTFCNSKRSDSLYILSDDLDVVKTIDIGGSATGITKLKDGFLVAKSGTALVKINEEFEIENIYHTGFHDIHSITTHRDEIYVAVTGTDSIVKCPIDSIGSWNFARQGSGKDSIHLNSVAFAYDELFYTNFGYHEGDKKNAKNGSLKDRNDNYIIENLKQPHSAKFYKGELYLLESRESRVFRDFKPEIVLSGYLRGLDFKEDHMYVGASRSRNSELPTPHLDCARLFKLDENRCVVDMIDFNDFFEIYEVLCF